MCLMDLLGSAIAGYNHEYINPLLPIVEQAGGNEESTLIGLNRKTSALWASFINGAMAHVCETDDSHRGAYIHPGSTVIPAALALGEAINCRGKEFLESIVVGYEINCRIGEAAGSQHYKIWHSTATCGTFGATAACCKLLKLNISQTADALGNSGTQAAGLWQFNEDRSMTKVLHTAKANFNGLIAALAAQNGFTGPHKIFEGSRGFLRAMTTEFHPEKLIIGLGENYKILENTFKIDACCGHTHNSIDAISKAIEKYNINPEDVIEIKVKTYPEAIQIAGNLDPKTPYEAKFSIPFCVALILIYGSADLHNFTQETLFDSRIRSLKKRIKLFIDPELEHLKFKDPKRWNSRLEILTNQGTYIMESYSRKGGPENPLNKKEVQEKFKNLVGGVIKSKKKIDNLIKVIQNIEHLDSLAKLTGKLSNFK